MNPIHPLDEPARRLLTAMTEVFARGNDLRPQPDGNASSVVPAPELYLELFEETRELMVEMRAAGELLLRHVLGLDDAPLPEDVGRAADRLTAATATTLRALDLEATGRRARTRTGKRSGKQAGMPEASEYLREIGLAHLDTDLHLGVRKGNEPVVAARPIPPETAHVWLLGRLFERMEVLAAGADLIRFERRASEWSFRTHTAPPNESHEFGTTVREQEWSLVDRNTLRAGAPVVDLFLATSVSDPAPPREIRMAQALRASFPGGFVVRERRGASAVYEELLRGRRIQVHEHSDETDYEEGWLGLGRVMAFEGDLHLRSPGMVFLPPRDQGWDAVAQILRDGSRSLPPAIAVEVMIAAMLGVRELPRRIPPAPSRRAAHVRLVELSEALDRAGLGDEVPADRIDAEALERVRGSRDLSRIGFREYDLDRPVRDWMAALMEQSRGGGRRRV